MGLGMEKITHIKTYKTAHLSADAIAQLGKDGFALLDAQDVTRWMSLSLDDIESLKPYWNDLPHDASPMDGGRYRYRRYARLEASEIDGVQPLSHTPFVRSGFNAFEPLELALDIQPVAEDCVANPALHKIVDSLRCLFDLSVGGRHRWLVQLHPYRIQLDSDTFGFPTPEGLHMDCVDFVATMLLHRENVQGGTTLITDTMRKPLVEATLTDPMDLIVRDDNRTLFVVSAVKRMCPNSPAFRDALTLSFTRSE